MNREWRNDARIDVRIRNFFLDLPFNVNQDNETFVKLLNADELGGGEKLISKEGFTSTVVEILSLPDNNKIKANIICPTKNSDELLPCVIYYHGGGMSRFSSFYNNFQTLGRLIASHGIIVVMPDFRNSVVPSQEGEKTAKFPGGLNDCVSTVHWVCSHKNEYGINDTIILSGESGGGNLALTTALKLKKDHKIDLIQGIYLLCPYLAGIFPNPNFPSTYDNAGILLDYPVDGETIIVTKYENEGDDLHGEKNCLAWPVYCEEEDIRGLPKCVVVVNEFDPLRDEGIDFHRKCNQFGVPCTCYTIPASIHGIGSYLVGLCPEITKQQAKEIANFTKK